MYCDALIKIKNLARRNFSQQKSTGMVLLDVKAAFDSVWQESLVCKMGYLNFPIELTKSIDGFLTYKSFRVHIASNRSELYLIKADRSQELYLSHVLRTLYNFDFPQLSYST